jgi:hypothetical protein
MGHWFTEAEDNEGNLMQAQRGTGNGDRDWHSRVDGVVYNDDDEEEACELVELELGLESISIRWDSEGATFVLANVQTNEKFCLGVSVSLDRDNGDNRDNGYSPLWDFELIMKGNEDRHGGGDDTNNARGGSGDRPWLL